MPRGRVLIVEDDRDIREELVALLEENDYCVLIEDHGLHALEVMRAGNRPDAIILDLMMPVMDGWQLLNRLRQDKNFAQVPLAVMSRELPPPGGASPKQRPVPQSPGRGASPG